MQQRRTSLWRHGDFLRLWGGQSISRLGSQVSLIAIPFAAVAALHASALQVGLLGTAEYLPWLLVGLPAGAVVDRLPRRSVLIAANLGRALVFASVPVVWWSGHLVLAQLYVVALLGGVLTVFFDVAYQTYLPALVGTAHLVEGNSKLEMSSSAASIAGPAVGGALIGAVGAAVAVMADAASYVVSVATLLAIRAREAAPQRDDAALPPRGWLHGLRADIVEGLRHLLGHRLLRPIVICTSFNNLFADMALALVVLFAVRDLHMSSTALGLAFTVGSLGLLAGATFGSRIAGRMGLGPTIVATALIFPFGMVLLALAPAAHPFWFIAGQNAIVGFAAVVYNVNAVSLRQTVTPLRLLGRVNAGNRFLVWGTIPIGTFIGGLLGGALGLRPTFWISAAGLAAASMVLVFSPLRGVRSMDAAVSAAPSAPA